MSVTVTVRNIDTEDPIEGAVVRVDEGSAATTDQSGQASADEGCLLTVYDNYDSYVLGNVAAKVRFSDPSGDREIWIEPSTPGPVGPGGPGETGEGTPIEN